MRLTLILLLLVANALLAAWSQDLLAPWWPAWRPQGVQPERLNRELRPQDVQLLSPKAAADRAALARAQEQAPGSAESSATAATPPSPNP